MGYRSDVAYVIQFDTIERKREFVALRKLVPETYKALSECKCVDDDSLYITAEFEYVKWYEGYDDVEMHMNMLRELDGDGESGVVGVGAQFIRVGEEADDIEMENYGTIDVYALSVSREICMDV